MNNVTCQFCKTESEVKMKTSFLGFKNFTCPSCKKTITSPLSKTYRVIYWLLAIYFVLTSIAMLMEGRLGLPSILAVAAIAALWMDEKYRKQLAERKSSEMIK